MPIYDFKCKSCGFVFEDFLKNSEEPNSSCTKCNCETERLISNFCGIVPGSENRTLDCVIGADAERRWNHIHEKGYSKRID